MTDGAAPKLVERRRGSPSRLSVVDLSVTGETDDEHRLGSEEHATTETRASASGSASGSWGSPLLLVCALASLTVGTAVGLALDPAVVWMRGEIAPRTALLVSGGSMLMFLPGLLAHRLFPRPGMFILAMLLVGQAAVPWTNYALDAAASCSLAGVLGEATMGLSTRYRIPLTRRFVHGGALIGLVAAVLNIVGHGATSSVGLALGLVLASTSAGWGVAEVAWRLGPRDREDPHEGTVRLTAPR
ncbi:MAG: hypothetical protein AAGF11_43250 [Myxococcota bacterium]